MHGNEVNVSMLAKYDGAQGYKKKALWIAKKIGDGEQEARNLELLNAFAHDAKLVLHS